MKILIAGDYCPQKRVTGLLERDAYSSVFGNVQSVIKDADYSIVNLECPITKGSEEPIVKCGPNLQCPEKGIEALKWAGIRGVTLANNHFLDFGEDGVENTLSACRKYGIDVVGGGRNLQEASEVLYKEISGCTLAIINCCEHEFSIATETAAGSNPLNPIQQYYAIQVARKHADFVLVIVHGGHEHFQLPSPRMQETYRFFIDVGADAVINHHQHCYSGYEVYKGNPIFYGLGNFCFDSGGDNDKKWNEGMMVLLHLDKGKVSFNLIPYFQCGIKAGIELLGEERQKDFLASINRLNQIINSPKVLSEKYDEYLNNQTVNHIFEPYTNRYLLALYKRHLLPSFVPKSKKTVLLAYLQCESHVVKILNGLKKEQI